MKFKKILAGAMAGAMVLGSVSVVSADTYTDAGWWAGTTGDEVTVASDYGQITYTVTADTGGGDFGVEAYSSEVDEDDAEVVRYISTFTYAGSWYYDATGDDIVQTGNIFGDDRTTTLVEGETYTVTVNREGADFTLTYTTSDGSTIASFYAANTNLAADNFSTHFYAQYGSYTVSAADTTSITASSDSMSVLVEESKSLPTITTTPSAMKSVLTYSSSDETVATVSSDGVVTGVASGTAVITAAYADYSTTIEVNVTEDAVALEGVTVSDTEVSIVEGASATVTATPNPTDTTDGYSTTWASADESIATVEDGVITGIAAGETTVTVTYTTDAGSFSAEVAVTVTEATVVSSEETSEEDTTSEESSEATTEEETETEETVTTVEESETMTIDTFWTTFTSGYEVTEDLLTLTFTTTSTGTNYYNNAIWALYSSDSGYICTAGEGSDAATEDNYVEYWVGRADYSGWGSSTSGTADTATVEVTATPDDWDAWFAATQAGATVTVTAQLDGNGNAVITCACEGYEYTITVPVDTDSSVYLALSGESCVLSDLTVNGESANFPILVEAAVEAETEETETEETTETTSESETTDSTTTTTTTTTTTGTSTGDADTGDASPIIPIAVAVLGCAAVVVASKKRMA